MTTLEALKQFFGYDNFRGGQEKLINDIVCGSDVLGIMPTGAGKSICFQIPALLADGITLVISPLISLMKDQVNALIQSGIAAAFINSSLTEREIYYVLQNAAGGVYKLIYIAPERLFMTDFLSFAQSSNISMLTVDEAHCISQWGQDFRPSYSKIPEFINRLPKRPVVSAFTATATPKVREDIVSQLKLQNPTILVTGFDRSNLYFEVQKPKDKFSALIDFLTTRKELSGIIYCSSRKTVEEVCRDLNLKGYKAARYHAGLQDSERHNNQDDFIYDRVQIMVATNAFGMGIDKSNVSYVVHYNMPKDIESYYQEAGRAGRDGEPADCILLYSGQDVSLNMWLIENSNKTEYPDKETELLVKERDRKRLKEMTFYCATYNCLRGYILRYFGENPPPRCGNCVNCNTDFETEDITVEVLKILSCIGRMQERFGINMIIDVLRGSKNEKVLSLKLNQLSTYGISDKSDKRLREIISFLIINGYLQKTDSEYPVIKFGTRANEVLRNGAKVKMVKTNEKNAYKSINSAASKSIRPVDKRLYEILRKLRQEIADKQRVPSFAIFSDSTLVDMCIKVPKTSKELLDVSGVGQVKRERYGESFLKAIKDFLQKNNVSETPVEPIKNNMNESTEEMEVTEEPVTVSIIADRINCITIQHGYGRINGKRINDWLVFEKYLKIITSNNKNYKIPTDMGNDIEIFSEERTIRGESLNVNLFGKKAQEFIFKNVQDIFNFTN